MVHFMALSQFFTIDFEQAFLPTFVQQLLQGNIIPNFSLDDPLALENITLILPTQRAIKSLRNVFMHEIDMNACILPRMIALGGLDTQQEVILEGADIDYLNGIMDIPPAIPQHLRILILAKLIQSWAQKVSQQDMDAIHNSLRALAPQEGAEEEQAEEAIYLIGSSPNDAMALARKLAQVMDIFEHFGLAGEAMVALLPEEYQSHWQVVAEFLTLMNAKWPTILASIGYITPVARQVQLMDRLALRIEKEQMAGPVIMVGSLGEQPVTRRLIKSISRLQNGYIVIPGLDRFSPQNHWLAEQDGIHVTASHPQHALSQLMAYLDLQPSDFLPLSYADKFDKQGLDYILSMALAPAGHTEDWAKQEAQEKVYSFSAPFKNHILIEAPDDALQATAIAMVMAQSVQEIPQEGIIQQTALVTPDRGLARRVSIELKRWGLEVDDTAGMKMLSTPAGIFFRLIAEVVSQEFSSTALLALLKHPLMSIGAQVYETRLLIRELEISILRGPKIGSGLDIIFSIIEREKQKAKDKDDHKKLDIFVSLIDFLQALKNIFMPFQGFEIGAQKYDMTVLLNAHLQVVRTVEEIRAAEPLFQYEDGIALTQEIEAVRDALLIAPFEVTLKQYPQALCQLMEERPVRTRRPKHPHLFIMGPLEARLHHFDTVIVAGLNEGTWPRDVTSDPWLSRPMRRDLGLPTPEFEIGLSAHDWCQTFSADQMIFSRSLKVDNSPTVASRWLQRLLTILPKTHVDNMQHKGREILQQASALTLSKHKQEQVRSAPTPPVHLRPDYYSVTTIEKLAEDPYSVFARHILKLNKLSALDEAPHMGDRGLLYHSILDEYYQDYWSKTRQHNKQELITIAEKYFEIYDPFPAVKALWWPRFLVIADWLIEMENKESKKLKAIWTEIKGTMVMPLSEDHKVTIGARADRINIVEGNKVEIIDYKTGQEPKEKDMFNGTKVQVPLEALIAKSGGFDLGLPYPIILEGMGHYLLKGRDDEDQAKWVRPYDKKGQPIHKEFDQNLEDVRARVATLINASLQADWSYHVAINYDPDPDKMPYLHLSRMEAWLAAGSL